MTAKIAISIDQKALTQMDRLVKEGMFPSRSGLIQQAVAEKLARVDRRRLARECSKLDKREEQALADEGLAGDVAEWPEY